MQFFCLLRARIGPCKFAHRHFMLHTMVSTSHFHRHPYEMREPLGNFFNGRPQDSGHQKVFSTPISLSQHIIFHCFYQLVSPHLLDKFNAVPYPSLRQGRECHVKTTEVQQSQKENASILEQIPFITNPTKYLLRLSRNLLLFLFIVFRRRFCFPRKPLKRVRFLRFIWSRRSCRRR